MGDIDIHLGADSLVGREAACMDWGVLVTESQDGVSVFAVGLPPDHAVRLLRKAVDALEEDSRDRLDRDA